MGQTPDLAMSPAEQREEPHVMHTLCLVLKQTQMPEYSNCGSHLYLVRLQCTHLKLEDEYLLKQLANQQENADFEKTILLLWNQTYCI